MLPSSDPYKPLLSFFAYEGVSLAALSLISAYLELFRRSWEGALTAAERVFWTLAFSSFLKWTPVYALMFCMELANTHYY